MFKNDSFPVKRLPFVPASLKAYACAALVWGMDTGGAPGRLPPCTASAPGEVLWITGLVRETDGLALGQKPGVSSKLPWPMPPATPLPIYRLNWTGQRGSLRSVRSVIRDYLLYHFQKTKPKSLPSNGLCPFKKSA